MISFKRYPERIFQKCVSACTQKTPNLRCGFLKRRLTNTPRRHCLADCQLLSLYPPSPSFSSFGAASVILCCSVPSDYSSTPLRPCVHYPSIRLVNTLYIQTFCEHLNVLYIFDLTDLYRFEVRLELYADNTRLIGSVPSLSPSRPPTPPPSRWSAVTTLPPLAKFQLVWRLCEAPPSSSSLAGQKHRSLLSRLV